jgi:hypothetical protein
VSDEHEQKITEVVRKYRELESGEDGGVGGPSPAPLTPCRCIRVGLGPSQPPHHLLLCYAFASSPTL